VRDVNKDSKRAIATDEPFMPTKAGIPGKSGHNVEVIHVGMQNSPLHGIASGYKHLFVL
jgi:hypothetical protein